MVPSVFSWFFMVLRLVFRGPRWVVRVNHGSRLVFYSYRSVFMIPGGLSSFLWLQVWFNGPRLVEIQAERRRHEVRR